MRKTRALYLVLYSVASSLMTYHIIIGLPAVIVLPAYFVLLLILVSLVQYRYRKDKLNTTDTTVFILGLCILASLSYALVPFDVSDRFPDANYIYQLLGIYDAQGKIVPMVGTNEAYYYSLYPLFEVFVLSLYRISEIPYVFILRFFSIFSTVFFYITWISIYKKVLSRTNAYIAVIIALTSFHFLVFFTRPLHPTFALMLASTMFLSWAIGSQDSADIKVFIISSILIFSIVLAHNTTGLLLGSLLVITLSLILIGRVLLKRFNIFNFTYGIHVERRIFYIALLMVATYFVYNAYIASEYFGGPVIRSLINYLELILSREITLPEIIVGRVRYNIISPNEMTIYVYAFRGRLGYISLASYLVLSGTFILRRVLSVRSSYNSDKASAIYYILDLLAISSALMILAGLTWPYDIRDYYWRFYSYYFLFSAPAFTFAISRISRKFLRVAIILFILLNSILWLPSVSLGVDMPYDFSDPRIGLRQAISLSSYIREKYGDYSISGTRVIFEVVGAFSEKWVYPATIYSEKDFVTAIERGIPVVLSMIESKLIGLYEDNLHNYYIVYNSQQYLMIVS